MKMTKSWNIKFYEQRITESWHNIKFYEQMMAKSWDNTKF